MKQSFCKQWLSYHRTSLLGLMIGAYKLVQCPLEMKSQEGERLRGVLPVCAGVSRLIPCVSCEVPVLYPTARNGGG